MRGAIAVPGPLRGERRPDDPWGASKHGVVPLGQHFVLGEDDSRVEGIAITRMTVRLDTFAIIMNYLPLHGRIPGVLVEFVGYKPHISWPAPVDPDEPPS